MNLKTFVSLYVLLALPTYLLPHLPAYSGFTHTAALSDNPLLVIHGLCLLTLVGLAWSRGLQTQQYWLWVLPLLALAFDLLPGLNWIYLLPSILHMATIVAGGFLCGERFTEKTA